MPSTDPVSSSSTNCYRLIVSYTDPSTQLHHPVTHSWANWIKLIITFYSNFMLCFLPETSNWSHLQQTNKTLFLIEKRWKWSNVTKDQRFPKKVPKRLIMYTKNPYLKYPAMLPWFWNFEGCGEVQDVWQFFRWDPSDLLWSFASVQWPCPGPHFAFFALAVLFVISFGNSPNLYLVIYDFLATNKLLIDCFLNIWLSN